MKETIKLMEHQGLKKKISMKITNKSRLVLQMGHQLIKLIRVRNRVVVNSSRNKIRKPNSNRSKIKRRMW